MFLFPEQGVESTLDNPTCFSTARVLAKPLSGLAKCKKGGNPQVQI